MQDRNKINERRFFAASAQNDLKTVRQLVRYPVNRAFESKHQLNAIEIAAMHQNWDVVLEIAKYKTDENDICHYGNALLMAVRYNQFNVALALLLAGAKPNRHLKTGENCLHLAVINDNPGMMNLLFRFGAHYDERDANKRTPSDLAEKLNQWQTTIPALIAHEDFQIARDKLVSDLNDYARQWTSLHRKRATSLSVACIHKAKTTKELIALLELQIDLFNPKYAVKMAEAEMKKLPFHERPASRPKGQYYKIIESCHQSLMDRVMEEELVVDREPIVALKQVKK